MTIKNVVLDTATGDQIATDDQIGVNISEQVDWDADTPTSPTTIQSGDLFGFELINSVTRSVVSNFEVPKNSDLGVDPVIVVHFFVSSTGGADANVRLQIGAKYIGVGELTTKAYDETLAQTVAVVNTLGRIHEATFTLDGALMSAGDRITLLLSRLGGDAADTFTGDIGIAEVGRIDYRG